MAEEGAQTLYTTDNTGNYVEYEPPAPASFNETLPEDLRDSEHLQGVDDGATLARYYVDLKKDYLAPPQDSSGYDFEKPDGFLMSDEQLTDMRNVAFESGLNQKQFGELMNFNVSAQKKALEAHTKQINAKHDEAEAELKAEWGANYEKNIASAMSLLNHESVADEDFKQFLNDTRFGDNPKVVKFFHKLSGLISEDTFTKPGKGDGGDNLQRDETGRVMLKFPSMET